MTIGHWIVVMLVLAPLAIYIFFAVRKSGQGKLVLKNPHTGHIRNAPVGFSWTVLLFSFFPPLFRKDWLGAVIIFVLALLTWTLSDWIFAFIYNKMYVKRLIADGFQVESADRDIDLISKALLFEPPLLESGSANKPME